MKLDLVERVRAERDARRDAATSEPILRLYPDADGKCQWEQAPWVSAAPEPDDGPARH